MQARTISLPKIKTDLGEFDVEPWNGRNESGFNPEGDRVLVLPDQCAAQSSGGILLPEEVIERISMAAETGVLVAMGPEAFYWNADRTRPRQSAPPAVGSRVYFERYSGGLLHGKDGRIYRVCDDKSIGAVELPATAETKELAA